MAGKTTKRDESPLTKALEGHLEEASEGPPAVIILPAPINPHTTRVAGEYVLHVPPSDEGKES